jgi:hypothetical protein
MSTILHGVASQKMVLFRILVSQIMLKTFELIMIIVHMQQGNFRIVEAEVALNNEFYSAMTHLIT